MSSNALPAYQAPTPGAVAAFARNAYTPSFTGQLPGSGEGFSEGFSIPEIRADGLLPDGAGSDDSIQRTFASYEGMPIQSWRNMQYHKEVLEGSILFVLRHGEPTPGDKREVVVTLTQLNGIWRKLFLAEYARWKAAREATPPGVVLPRITESAFFASAKSQMLNKTPMEALTGLNVFSLQAGYNYIGIQADATKADRLPTANHVGNALSKITLTVANAGPVRCANVFGDSVHKNSDLWIIVKRIPIKIEGVRMWGPYAAIPYATQCDAVPMHERAYQDMDGHERFGYVIPVGVCRNPNGTGPGRELKHRLINTHPDRGDNEGAYQAACNATLMYIVAKERIHGQHLHV